MTKMLFICRQNACRSQIAHGFAESIAAEMGLEVEVRSAGSEPAASANPDAIATMAELGIDISGREPRMLTPELAEWADVAVAVCGEDACPYIAGAAYWGIEDPAGRPPGEFRGIRFIIESKVRELLATL